MRTKRSRKIQQLVEKLLQLTKIETPPVDIERVAKLRGAEIRYGAFKGEGKLAGILFQEDNQIIIGVNESHPSTRQRFTIAHELGHLELHSHSKLHVDTHFKSPIRLRDEISSLAIDPEEIDANTFAAELLMPTLMIERDVRNVMSNQVFDYEDDEFIRELANRYEVSPQAMTFRLINLGFING
jgi:Zn-dependent peptidase ImmA (M78 family)